MIKLLFLISLFLLGCTTTQKVQEKSIHLSEDITLSLAEPRDILPNIQLVQVLTFQHQDKKNSSQVVLTSKDNKLTIVALLPFGGEAFRVEYMNGAIKSKSLPLGLPKDFDLKYALADIIIVYADSKNLTTWLSPTVELHDTELKRVITYKSVPIIQIQYDRAQKFSAVVNYENLLRNYKIHIQPVSQGDAQ